MKFIPLVKSSLETDEIQIPFITSMEASNYDFAKFKWGQNESLEDFLKKYSDSLFPFEKVHFYLTEDTFDEGDSCLSDLDLNAYSVKDDDGYFYYLVCLGEFHDFKDLDRCFCVPKHYFNLLQVYAHFKKLYPFMDQTI